MANVHPRSALRRYLVDLLKDTVDVGGRVFPNRPSPVFISEVPCVLVHFSTEPTDVIVGDMYSPKEYQANARVNIDFLTDEVINPDAEPNENERTEDRLDFLSHQARQAIFDDWTLAKRLPGFDGNNPKTWTGLSLGMRLVSADPYNMDVDSERRVAAQRDQFEIPYQFSAYKDYRFKDFKEYKAEILRLDYKTATDPVLLAAEGDL